MVAVSGFSQQKGIAFWGGVNTPQAISYVARFDVKPTGDTLQWTYDLINSLVRGGYWDSIVTAQLYCNNTVANALLDIKNVANGSVVNSPTFTRYRGIAGDGSTSCINTNFNDSTTSSLWARTAFSWSFYSRTDNSSTRGLGVSQGTNYLIVYPRQSTTLFAYFRETTGLSGTVTNSAGAFWVNLSGITGTVTQNDSVKVTGTVSPKNRVNLSIYVGARNNNGTPNDLGTREWAYVIMSPYLSKTTRDAISTIFRTYLQKVGAKVI